MKKINLLNISLAVLFIVTVSFPVFAADEDHVPAFTPKSEIDASPVDLPKITKKTLGNGLTIYYVPQHELPVVSMRLLVLSGSLYNPDDKPGLTDFMGGLLNDGTATRSSQEIAEAMDFIGGNLGCGAGYNACYVQSNVLARDFETGMDLLSDVALHPSFPEEEIERTRNLLLADLVSKKDDPAAVAEDAFKTFVYGDHPYGYPLEGTPESVQGFTRDDLVAQHKRLFVPGNAVLAIAGDIDVGKAHKMVKKYFNNWKKAPNPVPTAGDPEVMKGGEILVVDKPDAVQSEVRMGYVLSPYNMGDDFYAFKIMDYIYGAGGFSSRLMLKVRNELGLTYGIYSGLTSMQKKGAYSIEVATKTESTGTVIDESFKIMNDIIADGITEQELNDAKAYLIGGYPRRFETPQNIAMQFQTSLMFGFKDPADFIRNYTLRLNEVTLDDIKAMAKKYYHPDQMRIAIVGNAEGVTPLVEKYGNIEVKSLEEF